MARKVINTTRAASYYDILSQTPANYDKDNYFLRELQQKVDAEWIYRPNRVNIEYETVWGAQVYAPIEVVIQTVKSEKGKEIADDIRRVVFRDILDDRFDIGSRFRFGRRYNDPKKGVVPDKDQNVWIATNTDSVQMTSSMVIQRCNGTLGSLYRDAQGVSHYHYEPVIQASGLTSVDLHDSETAVSPQSQLTIVAQHNEFTRDYFINQRFIIGYDKVYRITAINKFYSNSTFDSQNVGVMHVYLELTERSEYDDFEHRIAYQDNDSIIMHHEPTSGVDPEYIITFSSPEVIPASLGDSATIFTPVVHNAAGAVVSGVSVKLDVTLENLPQSVGISNYVEIEPKENDAVSLKRIRVYLRGDMVLRWYIPAQYTTSQTEIATVFTMSLR